MSFAQCFRLFALRKFHKWLSASIAAKLFIGVAVRIDLRPSWRKTGDVELSGTLRVSRYVGKRRRIRDAARLCRSRKK